MKDLEHDYFYDVEEDAKYCYAGTRVLKNKLRIKDFMRLQQAERDYSAAREADLLLHGFEGDFSLKYLCDIHRYLFQDVYSWAGKIRTVDVSKGTYFCRSIYIEDQFNRLYEELVNENYLLDIKSSTQMADRLAYYLGEINMIHPFREGNGRTQRVYIDLLCKNTKRFELDFTLISKEEMIRACTKSACGMNGILEELLYRCIVKVK
ncbi:MAG: Fic family protein [Lachnospiraceae bacterium]|nr:Fic family protein [Lachnospiraceae bacterium]